MDKPIFTISLALLLSLALQPVSAAKPDKDEQRYWDDHAPPYSFLFGNHIDTHIELEYIDEFDLEELAGGAAASQSALLEGFFYVFWDTDEDGVPKTTTIGDLTDIPVLKHCTKQAHYVQGCKAGWTVKAIPCFPEINGCQAMNLYHYHDHPVWMVCPVVDGEGNLRGERQCISQDGSFTHFHWITEGSTTEKDGVTTYWPSDLNDNFGPGDPLPEPGVIDSPLEDKLGLAIDVPDECNVNMASDHEAGSLCPGFFLEITALRPFGESPWVFHHGGQDLLIQEFGADNKTHLNLLTSFPLQDVTTQAFEDAISETIAEDLDPFTGGHGAGSGDHGGSGGGGGGGGH